MNSGGDAAEQIVHISLEGLEVAAKITGTGAKELAILLATVIREEKKVSGKAKLTNLMKSGKELNVFAVQNKDLKKFSQEAKKYGVLYYVVKSKYGKEGHELVDILSPASDAPKINRIIENFNLATVDKGKVITEVEKGLEGKQKAKEEKLLDLANKENLPLERSLNEERDKPSVRKKLEEYKRKGITEKERRNTPSRNNQTIHQQPQRRKKLKER